MLDIIDVFRIADADEGAIFPTAEVSIGTIMLLVGIASTFWCIEVVLISASTIDGEVTIITFDEMISIITGGGGGVVSVGVVSVGVVSVGVVSGGVVGGDVGLKTWLSKL